jgi:hypothetical protein
VGACSACSGSLSVIWRARRAYPSALCGTTSQAICLPQRRAAITAALQLGGIEFTAEGPVLKSSPTQDSVEASESQSKIPALRSQL